MTPADQTRVWRKTRRKALRGVPAGRRTTVQVKTIYGHQQRERDHRATWLWVQARAEMEADFAARTPGGVA